MDGSPSTRWKPAAAGASLTVGLGRATTVGRTVVPSYGATTAYRIDVSPAPGPVLLRAGPGAVACGQPAWPKVIAKRFSRPV
ncbi:hypothetical protein ABZ901_21025 [Actinacidiphila alni]|uniref:hypothetical protein n=1 Tax=Actinacidiphila alni TaxID=380248 RepID=UPI0034009A80